MGKDKIEEFTKSLQDLELEAVSLYASLVKKHAIVDFVEKELEILKGGVRDDYTKTLDCYDIFIQQSLPMVEIRKNQEVVTVYVCETTPTGVLVGVTTDEYEEVVFKFSDLIDLKNRIYLLKEFKEIVSSK